MKHTFLALLTLIVAAHADPQIQITAELTGAAATAAEKFATASGERNPFPFAVATKPGIGAGAEIGQQHKYPTTVTGDRSESRLVGIALSVRPKFQGEQIVFEGDFCLQRLGASTRPIDASVVATMFQRWECPFSGAVESGKQITIDLSEQAGAPAALILTFVRVQAPK